MEDKNEDMGEPMDRHLYRAGWLTLYRPERQTYVLLHRCGLYTEVDADIPPELFGGGAWEALEHAASKGASGRHDLEVTQHDGGGERTTDENAPVTWYEVVRFWYLARVKHRLPPLVLRLVESVAPQFGTVKP